jgi:hypothetical protein
MPAVPNVQQKASAAGGMSLSSITTLSMPSKTRLGLQTPTDAKSMTMHRRSSLELNNNNMLPLVNAFLICMLTSILSTSGEQLPKVLAAATNMPPGRAAEQHANYHHMRLCKSNSIKPRSRPPPQLPPN